MSLQKLGSYHKLRKHLNAYFCLLWVRRSFSKCLHKKGVKSRLFLIEKGKTISSFKIEIALTVRFFLNTTKYILF